MKTNIEKQPKSTIKLTVTVPSDQVKSAYNEVLDEVVKNAEIPGFRKGTAPREMVKEKTDVSKLYGEVINDLLQKFYPQALKENLIAPISNPKVEIKEFDLEKDFEFVATVAVKPEIKIGDYKTKLKERYESKINEARKANEEKLKQGEQIEEPHVHLSSNDVIVVLNEVAEVEIADLLIEEEADRMMSRLVDQAQAIGLSLDQYLKAQNKTGEQLRTEYMKISEGSIKAELVLSKLVAEENIVASDEEIEQAYIAAGEPNPKEKLKNGIEKWYIKSVLEKNKLISKILEEIEGENHHEH